jgi:hypothetical protein
MPQLTIHLSGTEDNFARFVGQLQTDGSAGVEGNGPLEPNVVVTFTAELEDEDDPGMLLAEVTHD